ncbi:hypothetical protein PR048_027143 [Dryococelus australis]|uniref:Uncharacterized protein n=1 Tax=Dryococelus australis TaxID=614101 RepID=A0ABQ9GF51_9NEOP|nr:hypothetical protein PR048_027143 [Dryococelus australis]
MKMSGKRKIPEKTRRPATSFGTIPACENPGATSPGIESGSPSWEVSSLNCYTTAAPFVPEYGLSVGGVFLSHIRRETEAKKFDGCQESTSRAGQLPNKYAVLKPRPGYVDDGFGTYRVGCGPRHVFVK